ncbi:sensor histidine kinase [Natronomonas sp. LN261]|uniref:sensor histidine kinase n=1 Tax=Natronomonas sp. LN261 TaxID=2750669 RepID=UPI0015EF1487|nr:PAS domain-containing sensor histidine kinase [Natronomonas sp. LN261]
MSVPTSVVSLLVLATLAVSVGYVAFGVRTLRTRSGRGVKTLGGFAILWGIGNGLTNAMDLYLSAAFGVLTQAQFSTAQFPQWFELVLAFGTFLSILSITVAPFVWTAFVLDYTTQLRPRHRRLYTGAVAVVTLFVVLFTAPSILSVLGVQLGLVDGFLFLTGLVVVGSQVGVAGAGVAQLYKSSQRHDVFGSAEVLAVAAPLLLLFNNAANNFGFYGEFLRLYAVYISLHVLGIVGLVMAVERYDLFDQLPAATEIGRDTAMESVDLGIVVLDERDRIADMNEVAKTMFDTHDRTVIGTDYRDIHPSLAEIGLSAEQRRTIRIPETGRVLEADTTTMTDRDGRPLGAAVAFYDITEQKRRQERIQVLNRVLRHNLRNELTGARGYTRLLADDPDDAAEFVEQITEHHDRLISMGDKAQRIERMLELDRDAADPTPLSEIVRDSVAEVDSDTDVAIGSGRFTVSVPEAYSLRINPAILQMVLVELLENAVQHGDDPEIEISFREVDDTLVVTDTGPGIPDIEIEVLRTETETPTKHGQGLGLWLIKWGVDRLGGSIDIEADHSGTRVEIEIPAAHFVSRSAEPVPSGPR